MATAYLPDGTKIAQDPQTGMWNIVDENTYQQIKRRDEDQYIESRRYAQTVAAEPIADETSWLRAQQIAAGRGAYNFGMGIGHLWHKYLGDPESARAIELEQARREAPYEELRRRHPWTMGFSEGALPAAAGGLAGVGRSLLSAFLRQFGAGAAVGGLSYAPTLQERGTQAALEGTLNVAGEGIGRGIGRFVTPGLMPKAGASEQIIKEGEALGFRVLPATLVESNRFRNVVEGFMETMPTSAPVLDAATAENARLFGKYAAEAIGQEGAEEVSDVVLDKAQRELGNVFKELAGKDRMFATGDWMLNEVGRLEAERISPYLVGASDPVRNIVDEALNLMTKRSSGEVSGRELHANITRLGNSAKSVIKTNPELGLALFDMQGILLETLRRGLGPEDAARFTDARRKWKNLVNLKSAVKPETGEVMPGRLAETLKARDNPGYMLGRDRGPFYAATRFMARAQPELRSSGTGERTALQNIVASAMHLGPGVTGAAATDPTAAAIGFIAPFALPYAAARAYVAPSTKNWLLREPLQGPQFLPDFIRQPMPGSFPGAGVLGATLPGSAGPGFALTQQGLLGMGGIGVTHGAAGPHRQ